MSDPAGDKIKIEWDDLQTRRVDQRLREQEAVARNRQQADRVPVAVDESPRKGWVSHPAVMMGLFGLLGGLLAWGAHEAFGLRFDPKADADFHRTDLRQLDEREKKLQDQLTAERSILSTQTAPPSAAATQEVADLDKKLAAVKTEDDSTRRELLAEYGDNPYFKLEADRSITPDQRAAAVAALDRQQAPKNLIARLLSFAVTGLLISICLSAAEPLSAGNKRGAVVAGLLGAALGLVGGAASAFVVDRVAEVARPAGAAAARAAGWGVFGMCLAAGPAVAARNGKKFLIGLVGGGVGGAAGGAAFDPVMTATGGADWAGWGVALSLIGLTAGLATGLIENAAKNGWVKVTAGLIAGKQFILYRNPTFIGSGPECPIYLFRDPKVGKRHAAIHFVPGGFELENLPLGDVTTVNGKPVARAKLRAGDVIGIGATRFRFHEKKRERTTA